ncbi:MAG TPA: FAD-binding oxidoreductase [Anaerolineaceae bacterium]|nr:FAD-binding oxidoreductase [Anaerolineaceae bacterium]
MTSLKKTPVPEWWEETAPGSFRSLFKWGAPDQFKHPNRGLINLLMKTFGMEAADFIRPQLVGDDPVNEIIPGHLSDVQIARLSEIVGEENLKLDCYTRIKKSYGASMIDALRLRRKIIEGIPDAVVNPRSKSDLALVIAYCDQQRIPVYTFGGGSSVTRGLEAVAGGITIDMSAHMHKVVAFNEIDQTITIEAGMSGPQLEEALNQAPARFNARRRFTCGHFPQSFEFSSVGGWVVTRGAGQNSTYYGKIEDLVLSQEYVTPCGTIRTPPFPRTATGPDIDQIMIGSEGTFGVLAEVTLRIFRLMPENRTCFSFMFKDWQSALAATREIMQSEAGVPSVYRLSDPEETEVGMNLYGIAGTTAETILKTLGYRPMQKVLLLGSTDGEKGYCRNIDRMIRKICLASGAFDLSPFNITHKWEKDRFRDPYMREDLQDFGILIDTLECAINWSNLESVHSQVRNYIKSRPQTICMTHLSHVYPQGANLYFIFIAKIASIKEYLDLQYGILEMIQKSGAGISHHHGVGKQTAPWLEENIGSASMDAIRALKRHFDPNNILNPGGTLGLDLNPEQRARSWGKDLKG